MDKTISNKLNLIRIISMIMIVLCHYLQFFDNKLAFWFNVGVQIFFILSGVLYGCKDVKDYKKFWKNKFLKLYLPYFIVVIVFFVINLVLKVGQMGYLDLLYYLTATQAFTRNIEPLAHLWFMSYIFLFYLIIPILQKFDFSEDKHFYIKFLSLIIGFQFLQFTNVININVTYLALFMFGYYLSRRKFKHNINKDNYRLIFGVSSVICLIGVPVQLYLENANLQGLLLKFFTIYHDYIHAFLGISITIFLLKVLPGIENKIIDYFASVSFYIYLIHQIFILGVFSLLNIKYGLPLSVLIIIVLSNILYFIFKFINHKAK